MIVNVILIAFLAFINFTCQSEHWLLLSYALGCFFLGSGLLFFLGATLGVVRFPDFYTRMHAAGKGDTLSSVLILLAAASYHFSNHHIGLSEVLVGIKILLIMNFIFIGGPTATHVLSHAGSITKIKPWKKGDPMP